MNMLHYKFIPCRFLGSKTTVENSFLKELRLLKNLRLRLTSALVNFDL